MKMPISDKHARKPRITRSRPIVFLNGLIKRASTTSAIVISIVNSGVIYL